MNKEKDKGEFQNLIEFSGKIGRLEKGLEDLTIHFTNHLSQHSWSTARQWFIMALQTVVIIMLGVTFFK